MQAEIISIGDELTSGQRLNTNGQWLSQRLGDLGIPVGIHTTIGDDLATNVAVLKSAMERSDIICLTGGLGPTEDDLTRQSLAAAAGVELQLHPPSLQHIEHLFRRRQREMPPANRIQAMFPQGSRVIPNPHGTAPGIDMSCRASNGRVARYFALPGVPAEMREMWQEFVVPNLIAMLGTSAQKIIHRAIHCFGAGESEIERRLPNLIARGRIPQVGITASQATITLRITAQGDSESQCRETIEPTARIIYEQLGDLVFGEDSDVLETVVLRALERRAIRVGVMEAATQGLVIHWLARQSSSAFAGGRVLPDARDVLPHKSQELPGTAGAIRLAEMACREFGADCGLGIGRLTAVTDGSESFSVAIAFRDDRYTDQFSYTGHPDLLQTRAAKQAINFLRLKLAPSGL